MVDDKKDPARGFGALGGMITKAEEATKDFGVVPAPSPVRSSEQRATPPGTGTAPMPGRQVTTASAIPPGTGKSTPILAVAIGTGVGMTLLGLVLLGVGAVRQKGATDRAPAFAGNPAPIPAERVVLPAPQPLPASGVMYTYGSFGGPNRRLEAPIKIKAGRGSHFLVKLVHVGTNQPAMTIFVRSGETVEAEVPLGTFEVRYASGDTWYGDDLLFGPKTSYSKADTLFTFEIVGNQIQGFTITLYTVAHGNLKTKAIGASEF